MAESDSPQTPSSSPNIDSDDLRSIEDELFDLEDELIEMQGTTIRTVDQDQAERELQQKFAYQKPDDPGDKAENEESSSIESTEDLVDDLEKLQESMSQTQEIKPGQLLAADLSDENPQFEAGQYAISTPRGERIFAGRIGQVAWSENTVHVLPVKRIEGNVDPSCGDIRYDGSVFVEGNVGDSRLVEATGNIWVLGSVGRANLKASGDIIIKKGIKGNNENQIKAGGNIFAQFVENGNLDAGKNVIVDEIIMHSQVKAGLSIYLIGDPGSFVGGNAEAGKKVYVNELGSKNNPETVIRMGAAGVLQKEKQSLKKQKEKLESEESEHQKNVDNLLEQKKNEGLEPKNEERLRNYQFELNHVRQDLHEINTRLDQIEDELEGNKARKISVEGKIFPGVFLHISNASTEISEEKSKSTIEVTEGEIVFEKFVQPDLNFDISSNINPDNSSLEEKHEIPPLEELRRHLVFTEEEPLFDREEQFKRLMGLETNQEIVLIDTSENDDSDSSENGEEPSESDDTEEPKRWWAIEVREDENKTDVHRHFDSRRHDSVKVKCRNPREGVLKAADYFGVDPDELAVKILEEGSNGVLGIGQKNYLIRAKKKSAIKRERESEELDENLSLMEEAEQKEDVAGFVNIENTMDGLKLAVFPPEGHGLPVTVENVEEQLEDEGYTEDIDWGKVETLVEEQSGEPEVIAPRQPDPEIDGNFSVEVNEAETKAYLTVIPPKEDGLPVEKEDVIEYLDEEGINYDEEALDRVFEENITEEDVLIATGSEPTDGKNGKIKFQFDIPPGFFSDKSNAEENRGTPSAQNDDTKKVDHREGKQIISVEENEILAKIEPPTEGEPGETVYGKEIPCEPGNDIDFEAGQNVRKSGDGRQLIAEQRGRLNVEENTFNVEPVLVVEGDLDYETGDVDFSGVVVVKGQIMDGFTVEAGQRVEAGSIGKATVISDGDVVIENGIAGKEEGRVEAKGNVFAKFLENCIVEAKGNVIIEETVMHSEIDAAENIIVKGGKRGNIIGGKSRAGKTVSVNKLGSGMAPKTHILVGIKPAVRDRIDELENEIESQKGKFEKVRLGLRGLNELIEEVGGAENLPEDKKEQHDRLSNVANAIKHKIESLHGELEELRNEIQSSEGGEVYVENDAYSGSKITIQTATLHITDDRSCARFILQNGEVVKRSYEDPEIEIERPDTIL